MAKIEAQAMAPRQATAPMINKPASGMSVPRRIPNDQLEVRNVTKNNARKAKRRPFISPGEG